MAKVINVANSNHQRSIGEKHSGVAKAISSGIGMKASAAAATQPSWQNENSVS